MLGFFLVFNQTNTRGSTKKTVMIFSIALFIEVLPPAVCEQTPEESEVHFRLTVGTSTTSSTVVVLDGHGRVFWAFCSAANVCAGSSTLSPLQHKNLPSLSYLPAPLRCSLGLSFPLANRTVR